MSWRLFVLRLTAILCLSFYARCDGVRNSSAFLPNSFRRSWHPFSCEAVPHSLRKFKGRRLYLYKNFFLHTGKNFLYKSPPHIVSLDFSWQHGVLWAQRCARALSLHSGERILIVGVRGVKSDCAIGYRAERRK